MIRYIMTFFFGTIIFAVFGVGIANYYYDKTTVSNKWVVHTYDVINSIDEVRINLLEALSAERGYVITEMDDYLNRYIDYVYNVIHEIDLCIYLTKDYPEQTKLLKELKSMAQDKIKKFEIVRITMKTQGFAAAKAKIIELKLKSDFEQIRILIKKIKNNEKIALIQRIEMADRKNSSITYVIPGLTVLMSIYFFTVFMATKQASVIERKNRKMRHNKKGRANDRVITKRVDEISRSKDPSKDFKEKGMDEYRV